MGAVAGQRCDWTKTSTHVCSDFQQVLNTRPSQSVGWLQQKILLWLLPPHRNNEEHHHLASPIPRIVTNKYLGYPRILPKNSTKCTRGPAKPCTPNTLGACTNPAHITPTGKQASSEATWQLQPHAPAFFWLEGAPWDSLHQKPTDLRPEAGR